MGNGTITQSNGGLPRKTLMHKIHENSETVQPEAVGFQNSRFDSVNIEENLARLGRIHLLLEHLLLIRSNLKLENGNY